VEGAGLHTVDSQGPEPTAQLAGRSRREGKGQHLARVDLFAQHEGSDPVRQRPGLSRPGTGQDTQRAARRRCHGMLLGVEGGEHLGERGCGHCGILTPVTDTTSEQPLITVFTASWCGPCWRLKQRLSDHGISFAEIDVESDPASAAWVAGVNGGNQIIPTVRFADGSTLTNPPVDAVLARLESLAS
jgi:mycoredoxin